MVQRITEWVIGASCYNQDAKESLANAYFEKHNISASFKEIKNKMGINNFEKNKCSQLRGEDCLTIITGYREFLQNIECNEKPIYILWTLWNQIVFNILNCDSVMFRTFDFVKAQKQLDIFARMIYQLFPNCGIPDYIHIMQAHILDEIHIHGPLVQFSNQGFENHHQILKAQYKMTCQGGCGSKPTQDLIAQHYIVFLLRMSILDELLVQARDGRINSRNIHRKLRCLGAMPRDPEAKKQSIVHAAFQRVQSELKSKKDADAQICPSRKMENDNSQDHEQINEEIEKSKKISKQNGIIPSILKKRKIFTEKFTMQYFEKMIVSEPKIDLKTRVLDIALQSLQ